MEFSHSAIESITEMSGYKFSKPTYVFRPRSISKAVDTFKKHFSARLLYAVKTNPRVEVLEHLVTCGIDAFDVASLDECDLIYRHFKNKTLFYMHPVKSRQAIRSAYFDYGVRHFSLDTTDELKKIHEETKAALDLHLHVRLAIPNTYAEMKLTEKFGVSLQEACELLQEVTKVGERVGVCFHVGSQCMHPDAYRNAVHMAAKVVKKAKVKVTYFNVGGGFPSVYPGLTPPPLNDYFKAIEQEFAFINNNYQLLAEPGRALVAESMSLVVQVLLRKGDVLYLNDGTYGGLFDAGVPNFSFPTRMIGATEKEYQMLSAFSFYGPTCDSLDFMKGPFYLPSTIKEGDYIEIGQLGAYSQSLASQFNGFSHNETVHDIEAPPLMSMYEKVDDFCLFEQMEGSELLRGSLTPLS